MHAQQPSLSWVAANACMLPVYMLAWMAEAGLLQAD
jgi:hypothetical protein